MNNKIVMILSSPDSHGPSVEAALSTSPTEAIRTAEPRKSTIGVRKPASAKKSGVGILGYFSSTTLYNNSFIEKKNALL